MQDNRAIDRALARIAQATPAHGSLHSAGGKAITKDGLLKHARRYGIDGVLFTGWQAGLDDAALLRLAEDLDDIRVKDEGRYAKPLRGVQLQAQVRRVALYLS